MDKEEFLKNIIKMKEKADQYKKLEYLQHKDDTEYQELKRDIKKELLLGEFREE